MKILLGADGSTFSQIAEELIVRVPTWKSAEVICAGVAPSLSLLFSPDPIFGAATADVAMETYDSAKRLAKEHTDAAVSRLSDRGMKASAAFLEGDPGGELLDFAERNGIDLIAIGSRGLGPVESFILGSAARKLAAHAPCHVLIGRAFKGKTPEETLQFLRRDSKLAIAVGVDGTAGAQTAADFIKSQGDKAFEKVIAVCAEPLSVVPAGVDPSVFADLYKYDHERATAIAIRNAEDLKSAASQVTAETELGRPASAIGKVAHNHGIELIAVGATRHGTLERFLIGSVSHELASDGPCSVLIVRPSR